MTRLELRKLINKWIDSSLTEAESERLQSELMASPEARVDFLRLTRLVGDIQNLSNDPSASSTMALDSSAKRNRKQPKKIRHWWGYGGAAAAILCAVGLSLFTLTNNSNQQLVQSSGQPRGQSAPDQEFASSGCALFKQSVAADISGKAFKSGDVIDPTTIEIKSGMARFDFLCGASVVIEGPAQLEFINAWEARLKSGKLRAYVPTAARGFLVHTPDMKVEDRGTEFAINVSDGQSAVGVFKGEVIAFPLAGDAITLTEGKSISNVNRRAISGSTNDQRFIDPSQRLNSDARPSRLDMWQAWLKQAINDPRLLRAYTFEEKIDTIWTSSIPDIKAPGDESKSGTVIGAEFAKARWPTTQAVSFKRPNDRIRIDMTGSYSKFTYVSWVRLDALDKPYISLLLTDRFDPGQPHWQILSDGRVKLSMVFPPDDYPPELRYELKGKRTKFDQDFITPVVFDRLNLGRWRCLAVSYDNHTGECVQYVDGVEVLRMIDAKHIPDRPFTMGFAEIGNWGVPVDFPSAIRNFNGAIDDFLIYSDILSPYEIREIYDLGHPD
jgi:hypothetical protein